MPSSEASPSSCQKQCRVARSHSAGRLAQIENRLAISLRNALLRATPKSIAPRQFAQAMRFDPSLQADPSAGVDDPQVAALDELSEPGGGLFDLRLHENLLQRMALQRSLEE